MAWRGIRVFGLQPVLHFGALIFTSGGDKEGITVAMGGCIFVLT